MSKIYSALTVTFLICIFSGTAFSQCTAGGVPPYTSTRTTSSVGMGTNIDIDFELKRYEGGGINDYIFYPNGFLKYKGQNFRPAVLATSGITRFEIHTHRDDTLRKPNGLFSEGLAIALPKSNASKTVNTFYALDMDNCSSRKVAIRSLNLDKVIWSSKNNSVAILCEAEGERFALVNVKTGTAILSNQSKNNHPCGEWVSVGGYQPVKSLGTYEGPINDLFPEKVGAFQKTNMRGPDKFEDPRSRDLKVKIKVTEISDADYKSANGSGIQIAAMKFASPNDAKEGLKYFREHRRFSPQVERENNKVGVKKSGGRIIGERVESVIISQDGTPKGASVLWTNGSMLFIVEGSANLAVILAFEKHFPY